MQPFDPQMQPPPSGGGLATIASTNDAPRPSPIIKAKQKVNQSAVEDQELLNLAHERFRIVVSAEASMRNRWEEELDFLDLQHWTEEMKAERAGKPCLVFDRIGPACDQIVNSTRQDPPEVKFYPVGEGADEETAKILQGMLRNIEEDSGAWTAYETAYEAAVQVGRGWWRYKVDYESDLSFRQKITIEEIGNIFSVYCDPAAVLYDKSDMRYLFLTEDNDQDVFREKWPNSTSAGIGGSEFEGLGDAIKENWFPNGAVRTAEYWWIDEYEDTIVRLMDGRVVPVSEIPIGVYAMSDWKRKVTRRKVQGALICGTEILDRWEWLGQYIPFVPVQGKMIRTSKEIKARGVVRPAMDANLSYDVMRSRQVEVVGLGTMAPIQMAVGQDEGFEHEYARANRDPRVLHYHPTAADGTVVGPPQRLHATVDIGGITTAVQYAENDIKATTQEYDASLGAPGPESSGRAILARQRQSDNAHFGYRDNLARSMRRGAIIALDLIPRVYDEERIERIIDEDGKAQMVTINGQNVDRKTGMAQVFDIAGGGPHRFNVALGTGSSRQTRMQEAAEVWPMLAQNMPIIAEKAPDLIVKSTGLPLADEISERVKPPGVDDGAQDPAVLQAQNQQLAMMVQQLQAELQQAGDKVKVEQMRQEAETFRATLTAETQLAIESMKTGSKEILETLKMQLDAIQASIAGQQVVSNRDNSQEGAVAQ